MIGLAQFLQLAKQNDSHIALQDEHFKLTYRDLLRDISEAAEWLRLNKVQRLALQLDNSVSFLLWDLAAQLADVVCVPLPLFFTAAQQQHVLDSASIDLVLLPSTMPAPTLASPFVATALPVTASLSHGIAGHQRQLSHPVALPAGTSKITFTSGTTGTPKGVCLSVHNQWQVAQSLQSVAATLAIHSHLCVLPLAVLLENVAGVYSALLSGARVVLPSLAAVGLKGSSQFDPDVLLSAVAQHEANSIILLPQMLSRVLDTLSARDTVAANSLRFVAVGGARVAPELLARADALNVPVYEGYGLSECSSVVAVNAPGARRAGTVGKPLPHVWLERLTDGELLVHGNSFLGYLGDSVANTPATAAKVVATGDLGAFDSQGFLQIQGRKKNLIITGFGRNVSPEWPESELLAEPLFLQAAVFGEGKPALCAVVVAKPGTRQADLDAARKRVNQRLPDYAHLHALLLADDSFRADNGLLTSNGRPKREAIWQRYCNQLEVLFQSPSTAAPLHDAAMISP